MVTKIGSVTVRKDIQSVFIFISQAENLHKQIPKRNLEAYRVALEHGLQGPLRSGHQLAVLVSTTRRGRKDYRLSIEVGDLARNQHVELKMIGARVHHDGRGDITSSLPIQSIIGRLGMVVRLHPANGCTIITLSIKIEPAALGFRPTEFMMLKLAAVKCRTYLSAWAARIEASA